MMNSYYPKLMFVAALWLAKLLREPARNFQPNTDLA